MKKILLIVTMIVALFVSPVMADAPVISVTVDYKDIPQKGVMLNGTVYVPLRAVSEAMGATVKWFPQTQTAFVVSDAEPVVEGDANFKAVIAEALKILDTYDPTAYKMVCDNVRTIGVSDASGKEGVFAFAMNGSSRIDFTREGIASNFFVPQYVASVIVHEAVHCTQLQHSSALTEITKRDEVIAHMYEFNTLTIINAPQWMKDGCLESMAITTK